MCTCLFVPSEVSILPASVPKGNGPECMAQNGFKVQAFEPRVSTPACPLPQPPSLSARIEGGSRKCPACSSPAQCKYGWAAQRVCRQWMRRKANLVSEPQPSLLSQSFRDRGRDCRGAVVALRSAVRLQVHASECCNASCRAQETQRWSGGFKAGKT